MNYNIMTIQELKEIIKDIPDDMEVFVECEGGQVNQEVLKNDCFVYNGIFIISIV